jgi:hypothetical protein
VSGLVMLLFGAFGGVLVRHFLSCRGSTSEFGALLLSVRNVVFMAHIVMYSIEAVGRDP